MAWSSLWKGYLPLIFSLAPGSGLCATSCECIGRGRFVRTGTPYRPMRGWKPESSHPRPTQWGRQTYVAQPRVLIARPGFETGLGPLLPISPLMSATHGGGQPDCSKLMQQHPPVMQVLKKDLPEFRDHCSIPRRSGSSPHPSATLFHLAAKGSSTTARSPGHATGLTLQISRGRGLKEDSGAHERTLHLNPNEKNHIK